VSAKIFFICRAFLSERETPRRASRSVTAMCATS
jgi:hypothetical protein